MNCLYDFEQFCSPLNCEYSKCKRIKNNDLIEEIYLQLPVLERKMLENWKTRSSTSIYQTFIKRDEKIIAFGELLLWKAKKYKGKIVGLNFAVLPEYRRLGCLKIILKELVKYLNNKREIEKIYWGVFKFNNLSINLAKKYKFIFDGCFYNSLDFFLPTKIFINKFK